MWSNYILTSLRTLERNKFFVGVNLLSIAIAFSLCTIAWFNFQFNMDFNQRFDDADHIFKVNAQKQNATGEVLIGTSPLPLAMSINADTEGLTATNYRRKNQAIRLGDQLYEESVAFVDEHFFEVFNFDLISGGLATFSQQHEVYIYEQTALKLFGDSSAIGQIIEFTEADAQKTPFTVAGVMKDLPNNTSFLHTMIAPADYYLDKAEIKANDWTQWVDATFVKVAVGIESPDALLNQYLPVQNEVNKSIQITQYSSIHLLDWPKIESQLLDGSFMPELHPASVFGTISSALTVLLLACFNFINTSIAISRKRLKEIGIRKVMGGKKRDLKIQFLVESLLQMLIALALSGLITLYLIKPYNAMFNFEIVDFGRIDLLPFLSFLIGTWLITALLAGMYPAFYISKFKPVEILKNKVRFSGKNIFVKALLTFQFMVCVYNVFSLIVFGQNAQYQETLDRGYRVKSSINIPLNSPDQFEPLQTELLRLPEVTSVSGTEQAIGFSMLASAIDYQNISHDIAALRVGEGYLNALELRLTEGSFFGKNQPQNKEYVIINQMLHKKMGENALQQWLMHHGKRYTIIGVVDDFNLKPIMLDNKIQPTAIFFASEDQYQYANVVVNQSPREANALLKTEWNQLYPEVLYQGFLQEDVMKAIRQTNHIMLNINGVVAVITLLISSLGLYAMIYLNIQSRIKEFGVRKVLGASVGHILYLLNRQVVIMLIIASILGVITGNLVINQILDIVYAYHRDIELMNHVWPVAIVFFIAFAAIGVRVYLSARQNPVKQLRVE